MRNCTNSPGLPAALAYRAHHRKQEDDIAFTFQTGMLIERNMMRPPPKQVTTE